MSSKILIAAGFILAFVIGTMAAGLYTNTSKAFNPEPEVAIVAPSAVKSSALPAQTKYVGRTQYVQPNVQPRAVAAADPAPAAVVKPEKKRSWQKSAVIIGGSAGAGAAIGAVSGGKKGAAIGAVSGGVAGLVYDIATRNKKN